MYIYDVSCQSVLYLLLLDKTGRSCSQLKRDFILLFVDNRLLTLSSGMDF